MTAMDYLRALHIVLGMSGITLGPIAMTARKRPGRHTQAGEAYHWVMLGICLTAIAMALLDWKRIGWFLYVAAFSYSFALLGYLAAKLRWKNWLYFHLTGQGGSYIAMSTAVLVVNWKLLTGIPGVATFWPWVIPTLVGSPMIAWITREVRLGRRPRF